MNRVSSRPEVRPGLTHREEKSIESARPLPTNWQLGRLGAPQRTGPSLGSVLIYANVTSNTPGQRSRRLMTSPTSLIASRSPQLAILVYTYMRIYMYVRSYVCPFFHWPRVGPRPCFGRSLVHGRNSRNRQTSFLARAFTRMNRSRAFRIASSHIMHLIPSEFAAKTHNRSRIELPRASLLLLFSSSRTRNRSVKSSQTLDS